jgi:hypothetical protein
MFPAVLIGIGASALLDSAAPFWLAVGIYFLSRGLKHDHYPLLIAGAFVTGSATGHLVGDLIGGLGEPLGTFGTAAGFAWLWSSDRPRSGWAIFGAGIFGLIGLVQLGARVGDVASDSGGGWLLPAGVVVAGILLLGAHRMPGPLRLAGLVFVAAAALSLLANAGDRNRDDNRGPRVFSPPPTLSPQTFEIGERTVHIVGANGSVLVQEGDPKVISGRVVRTDAEEVRIEPRTANGSIVVSVPQGTRLDIRVDNGSVQVQSATNVADIATDNGAILLDVLDDPSIDAETSNGQIVVDNKAEGDDYEHDGEGGEVELDTDSGQIVVSHRQPVGAGTR